ncbi:MAG: hypothetical protein WDO56_11355 [Gammaproteobacteria bacterium]
MPADVLSSSSSAQIDASSVSTGPIGASPAESAEAYSGTGSARRSILPFGVSGIAASCTNSEGDHVLGQAAR